MKHYSDDSKKLIKNVVSLVVSALLLAAATVAWFATNTSVSVGSFSASVSAPRVVYYARMTPDDSFLDFAVSNNTVDNSALKIRTRPSTYTDVNAYVLAKTGNNDWIASGSETTSGASAAVDANGNYICKFVPGEYGAYRITFSGDGQTNTLSFSNITFATAMTSQQADAEGWDDYDADEIKEAAFKSIYVYSFLRTTTPAAQQGGEPTIVTGTPTKQTLYDLVYRNNAYQTSADVLSSSAAPGTTVEMYYVIGMPANDDLTTHDVIRHAGATITIGLASVGSGSSGGSGS